MSLRGKDVRPEIDGDVHEKLLLIAEFRNENINTTAALLLEKAVMGEWHSVSVVIERIARSGIARNIADSRGQGRS